MLTHFTGYFPFATNSLTKEDLFLDMEGGLVITVVSMPVMLDIRINFRLPPGLMLLELVE